jgi:hypothetical protein
MKDENRYWYKPLHTGRTKKKYPVAESLIGVEQLGCPYFKLRLLSRRFTSYFILYTSAFS